MLNQDYTGWSKDADPDMLITEGFFVYNVQSISGERADPGNLNKSKIMRSAEKSKNLPREHTHDVSQKRVC